MKILILVAALSIGSAFAHPNGTYVINGDKEVTVTFLKLNKCPAALGALTGSLRQFTFSSVALAAPYSFVSGNFVEIHEGAQEVYVQTTTACVPVEGGARYKASHTSFDVYSLEEI